MVKARILQLDRHTAASAKHFFKVRPYCGPYRLQVVRPAGFEPATFCSGGFGSLYLSITYLHFNPIRSSIFPIITQRLSLIGGGFGGVTARQRIRTEVSVP
jgi:hypothetical protein